MASNDTRLAAFHRAYLKSQLVPLSERLVALIAMQVEPSLTLAALQLTTEEQSLLAGADNTLTPALERLCQLFQLSAFERAILLLAIGFEYEPTFTALCMRAQLPSERSYPTLELALKLFPQEQNAITALESNAPLRYWQLVTVIPGTSLLYSQLKVSGRILEFVLGFLEHEECALLAKPVLTSPLAISSHQALLKQIEQQWLDSSQQPLPILNLVSSDVSSGENVALLLAQAHGYKLASLKVEALATDYEKLMQQVRLLQRAALLTETLYWVSGDAVANRPALVEVIQALGKRCLMIHSQPYHHPSCAVLTIEVAKLSSQEQLQAWQALLKIPSYASLPALIEQFPLDLGLIRQISQTMPAELAQANTESAINRLLWQHCRERLRQQPAGGLIRIIRPQATWQDLVLPRQQSQLLEELLTHVAKRYQVYYQWGFVNKGSRGLGLSALFAGPSGTGKTLAAEVLANALEVDLYHIDLSALVSKYIGETEKNLKQVFDAAEMSGAILLFDEADALFARRTEVKDSHDRYANLEVSYLLQRMEAYRGLSILTTNLKNNLDAAFLRRLRFIINFPYPDYQQRYHLWQQVFPVETPTEQLAYDKLAQLMANGGMIRNIALQATFKAAKVNQPVGMQHVFEATKVEYQKMGKILNMAEIKQWL